MNEQTYLIFSFNHSLYGISTAYVEEIVLLPELTHLPETSHGIVGAFNLRGHRCLVVDLQLRMSDQPSSHRSPNYQLSDSVVVISWERSKLGIIANKVLEIKTISSEELAPGAFDTLGEVLDNTLNDGLSEASSEVSNEVSNEILNDTSGLTPEIASHQPFFQLTRSENILILSNPEGLIQSIESQLFHTENYLERILTEQASDDSQVKEKVFQNENLIFCPSATSTERNIFQQRASDLGYSKNEQALENLVSLVVILLNHQLLGIHSDFVQEFVDVSRITPVPCCPEPIVGNMNLRGEILTLIDIRSLLKLPCPSIPSPCVAVVVKVEDIVFGILVEEVRDAMYLLNPRSIESASDSDLSGSSEYLQGRVTYTEEPLSILDLPQILFKGGLLFDEIA